MADNSFVTGLGDKTFEDTDDGENSLLYLPEPQATSTTANKQTRLDIAREYLKTFKERELQIGATSTFENHAMRQNTLPGDLAYGVTTSEQSRDSGSLGGLSLINVDNMSGLSSSMLLVDHKTLSSHKDLAPLQRKPTSITNGYISDDDRESPIPALTQEELQDLETDFSDGETSGLSEGVDEEIMAEGIWFASGTVEPMVDGLPSCVLEPQDSILWEMQASTGVNAPPSSLKEQLEEKSIGRQQLINRQPLQQKSLIAENCDDSVFNNSKVNFDAGQISARSTTFGSGLDVSKLLSTSCNSLGSLGEAQRDNIETSFANQSWGNDPQYDVFETEQGELASALFGESFHEPDLDFLEKEEEDNKRANIFMQEESCTANDLDISCFSGIYGVQEITVRPSWIESPDKMLLGPGNRMNVEDYLKLRSEALGSLGHEDALEEERPNFGLGNAVNSPPSATEPLPHVQPSDKTDAHTASYMHQDEMSKKNAGANHSNDSQDDSSCYSTSRSTIGDLSRESSDAEKSSSSSGSDTLCNSQLEKDMNVKEISVHRELQNQVLVKNDGEESHVNSPELLESSGQTMYSKLRSSNMLRSEGFKSSLDSSETSKLQFDYKKTSHHLERTLNEITGPMNSAQIRELLSEAIACDNPQELVEKIIKLSQEKLALHKTADMSDLDTSTDVLELRKQREALQAKQSERLLQKLPKVDKENLGKENYLVGRGANKTPLQMSHTSKANNIEGIPHKHMEKLKAKRTDSAPSEAFVQGGRLRPPFVTRHLQATLGDSHIDESIQIAPYKSRILEDTQKLHLSSFHNSTNSGFDASTPCNPRSKSRSSTLSNNGTTLGVERRGIDSTQHITNVKEQRPKPRMGLASAQHNRMPLMGTDRGILSGGCTTRLQRPESSLATGTDKRALGMVTPSVRSTSVPSGLHGMGVDIGGNENAVPQPVHSVKSLRQHHSQEDVNFNFKSQDEGDNFSLPKKVVFPGVSVLGIASEVTVVFHNPKQRWVQLSLRSVKEALNGSPTAAAGLVFKPSYFVEPQSVCQIQLKICSQQAGDLEALLEVEVSDLTKGSAIPSVRSGVSVHNVLVCAQIEEPHILLTSGGNEAIDFGVVPEGCCITKEVMVINQSQQSLPVILTLQQVAATSPIFCWSGTADERMKVVSATHVACELPSANTEHGPIPMVFQVTIKAPHLDKVKVDESGVVGLRSQIQVELDTPDQSTIIVAAMNIKAHVGVVKLHSLCTSEPMVLETICTESSTASVPLRNSSSFPLRISLVPQEHKNVFSVVPAVTIIQPHSQASPSLIFAPKGQVGKMESVLLMRIEPDGMEFEVSMIGVSSAPVKKAPEVTKLLSHSALSRATSAPVPQKKAIALDSTKTRLVFGTERLRGKVTQKIVLRNNCTTDALNLVLGIKGSKDFQICEYGGVEGKAKMEVVFKPCQEVAFSVFFSPTTVEALSGTLVFRPRGVVEPIKYQIPLQGYGGHCELQMPDVSDNKSLLIRELAPGLPAIFKTAFVNKGDRAMFVKIQVFLDEKCTQIYGGNQITVQPPDFVVDAHKSRDIFVVAKGTDSVLSKIPGCIGYLQIIYGDEILRRRFRRLKNKEVKVHRINDPELVKIDWDILFSGEKDLQNEKDSLPPQPEDAAIFFNSCCKTQVELHGERQLNEDASSTVFACLDAEDTITSVTDLTVAGDRSMEVQSPPVHVKEAFPRGTVGTAEAQNPPPALTWDVFPPNLTLPASDISSHTLFVVNFSSTRQMFEVISAFKWLQIEPREAILPSLSSVRVNIKLVHSALPQPLVSPVSQSIQIMCENECRKATVTILPDKDGSNSTHASATPNSSQSAGDTVAKQETRKVEKNEKEKPDDHSGSTVNPLSSQNKLSLSSASTRTRTVRSTSVCKDQNAEDSKVQGSIKSMVEVAAKNIAFPDTKKSEENYVKVKLRNHDKVIYTVRAEVTQAPFVVRHHQFQVKAGHFVSVPIYFRPQNPGVFLGQLKLCIVEEQMIHTVQLSGKAL